MIRSPVFNFVFGMVAGAAIGSAVATHVITLRVETANRAASLAGEAHVAELVESFRATLASHEQAEAELTQRAQACEAMQKRASTQSEQNHFFDGWYTLLYEQPTPPPRRETMFELLNVLRPGLGTALAKVQSAKVDSGLQPRWLLKGGNLTVVVGPPGSQEEQVDPQYLSVLHPELGRPQ